MKIKELLKFGTKKLSSFQIDSPQLTSEIFLSSILNKSKTWLISNLDFEIEDKRIIRKFKEFINRRCKREPVAYILEKSFFYSYEFFVNKNVLIPRQETEILVDIALEIIREKKIKNIIEIGTGSGCISYVLKKKNPLLNIIATDISFDALKVAKKNFKNLNILTVCCNLFSGIKSKFDMIISNPPYIKSKDLKRLPKDVKLYEPSKALDGGENGLFFYEKIIKDSIDFLNNNGYILLENGYISNVKKISLTLKRRGFKEIKVIYDYNKFPRVILGKFIKKN